MPIRVNDAACGGSSDFGVGFATFNVSSGGSSSTSRLVTLPKKRLDIDAVAGVEIQRLLKTEFARNSGSEEKEFSLIKGQEKSQRSKRKRYNRHAQYQIKQMEAFFKECPHPNEQQRQELSETLGLNSSQVKFWFQNKRSQLKANKEQNENLTLVEENEKLSSENALYKEAKSSSVCPKCGIAKTSIDEQQLRLENARLKEEIKRISNEAREHEGTPFLNCPQPSLPLVVNPTRSLDFGASSSHGGVQVQTRVGGDAMSGANNNKHNQHIFGGEDVRRQFIIKVSMTAMDELMKMARIADELWIPTVDKNATILNEEEYVRAFPRVFGHKPEGFKIEASKETTTVRMSHLNLVETLMNVNLWQRMFSSIVSKASLIETISPGVVGSLNGALQVITSEYYVPSPLVRTRESYFARYCEKHADGTWAVVDLSLDDLVLGPSGSIRCRRRPSGCVIQEMPNGYSKVTWIEHVEIEDKRAHYLYEPFIDTGLAFGARRWLSSLDRQCERFASTMTNDMSSNKFNNFVITTQEGRNNFLKLAEKMVLGYWGSVNASNAHTWTNLIGNGGEEVRVSIRSTPDGQYKPFLIVATSFWLPFSPKIIFDFVRAAHNRSSWDILSDGGLIHEIAQFPNGGDISDCVSLLRVLSPDSHSNMLIIQESYTDKMISYVVYSPVDLVSMNAVLSGGDPDHVQILPSGFSIVPGGYHGADGGTLMTVSIQIHVNSLPDESISVESMETINNLISRTTDKIKTTLLAHIDDE